MPHYYPKGHVRVAFEPQPDETPYTVPIPEGLTEEFEPSKPVTGEEALRFLNEGIEPYPGYADEHDAWERAWDDVAERQAKADGTHWKYMDVPMPPADFDADGNPVQFGDEPHIMVDADSGRASLAVSEDEPFVSEDGKPLD